MFNVTYLWFIYIYISILVFDCYNKTPQFGDIKFILLHLRRAEVWTQAIIRPSEGSRMECVPWLF